MSVAGLKKQFNKVNQYMSEKIGGAKGTELDDEFTQMEQQIDVMGKLVDELMARTHELLQPNPASRAKLSAVKSISKMRGQSNAGLYPQPEGQLGECMVKHGRDLGDDSLFGAALVEAGETYKTLADVKYSLEDNVKQNFIEPLQHIQTKDLKEVNHHRKKMSGRRLDYDCKRRKKDKGASVPDEEIHMAEEKFEESKSLTETAMFNLLDNDVEQISALASFIEAEANFHRQSADALEELSSALQDRVTEAANRPRRSHVPKRVASSLNINSDKSPGYNEQNDYGGSNSLSAPSYSSYGSSKDVYGGDQTDYRHDGGIKSPGQGSMSTNSSSPANNGAAPLDPFGAWDSFGSSSFQSGSDAQSDPMYASIDYAKKSKRVEKPPRYSTGNTGSQACAKALYDFEPENEGELGFKEGDMINLIDRIDDNWFEGSVHGVTGYFPVNYVDIVVPL